MHTLEQLRSGKLAGTKRVSINEQLSEFPTELFDLASSLEVLDLSKNNLDSLPEDFGRLKKLKAAFFFNNSFKTIPLELKECPQLDVYGFRNNQISHIDAHALPSRLRWLILTGNQLKHLPEEIGHLVNLQKCMLAGNQLLSLPDSMQECARLELLRISANQLQELPSWLLSMPRLSWLAYAGNPLSTSSSNKNMSIPPLDWKHLEIKQELGQGASGIVYQATRHEQNGSEQQLAVKLFKAGMTSDGSPFDERDANIRIGSHPNLASVIAELSGHPEQKQGLVMELIPPHFKNMSGPPNLDTCTRDTYPESRCFSLAEIVQIATGMASFAQHCHKKGVMHGDLYPHNTLVDEQGNCLVSDFGAATCFDVNDKALAEKLEKIEVRAWACALDDMLERIDKRSLGNSSSSLHTLTELRQTCFDTNPNNRPDFDTITRLLRKY